MNKRTTIRKPVAILLLFVFMVSAMPKAFFHDLVAQHKDTISCTHGPVKTNCMHIQGTNCHFDELVVTIPFLYEKYETAVNPYQVCKRSYQSYDSHFVESPFLSQAGRSPPVC
ncbi:MAG TPA: hypothetical protein VJ499_06355 [Flavisolibacter sp.]|nr:hypothetical protein [Flavisolibacter sp.]